MTNSALTALLEKGRAVQEGAGSAPGKGKRPVSLISVILWSWVSAALVYLLLASLVS